jgi:hypothetical protein
MLVEDFAACTDLIDALVAMTELAVTHPDFGSEGKSGVDDPRSLPTNRRRSRRRSGKGETRGTEVPRAESPAVRGWT